MSSKSKITYGLIAFALVAVIAGVVLAGGDETDAPTTASSSETADKTDPTASAQSNANSGENRDPAPNISGPDVADPNKQVSLEDFRGKPVVVQVWASWCPICQEEAPDIAAFQKANPDVVFIGVNVEDTQSAALAYKEQFGLTHEQDISDPDRAVEGELGFTGQPNSMVIDKQGRIVKVFPGAVSKQQLEKALNEI